MKNGLTLFLKPDRSEDLFRYDRAGGGYGTEPSTLFAGPPCAPPNGAGKDKEFELYAALTRLPVHPRIYPTEAARIVAENILPHFVWRC
jgi:hypothetical protein